MVHGDAPKIDGLSSDVAWEMVPWGGGDFRQRNPDAGAAPSVQTWFKVVYDAKNLYILIKNLDPEPNKIVSRMSRRDGFDGDWVEVNIDSYADKRSVFSFTSSVSGQYLCVEVHLSLCIIGDSSQALLLLIFI